MCPRNAADVNIQHAPLPSYQTLFLLSDFGTELVLCVYPVRRPFSTILLIGWHEMMPAHRVTMCPLITTF